MTKNNFIIKNIYFIIDKKYTIIYIFINFYIYLIKLY